MQKRLGWPARLAISAAVVAVASVVAIRTLGSEEEEHAAAANYGAILEAAVEASDTQPECNAASVANRAGMSGSEAKADTHGNDAKTMWCASPAEGQSASIVLDLGRVEPLGEMWVWNYNAQPENGLKDIKIYMSTDGQTWDEWKGDGYPFRLAKADGSDTLRATNLEDGGAQAPVRFEGAPARYVKLVADDKAGKGNWSESGERTFGLSEVRLYRYSREVVYKGQIDPLAATEFPADEAGLSHPENVINHYGMNGVSDSKDVHGNDANTMWLTASDPKAAPSLTVDLGGTYPLGEMRVWNYNGAGADGSDMSDRGMRDVSIMYSIDGHSWAELKGEGYPYRFARADGSGKLKATNLDGNDGVAVTFGGAQARYVKLEPIGGAGEGNWGAADGQGRLYYGLSELRFYSDAGIAAEPAPEWTGLFSRFEAWTGADGIFSIPLDGYDQPGKLGESSRTLFEFSDTFAGRVNGVSGIRESGGIVNNSIGLLTGSKPDPTAIRFDVAPKSADLSLFTPHTPLSQTLPGSWYWLQDGLAKDGELYAFPILMANDPSQPAGFQFAIKGVSMIKVPLGEDGPDYGKQTQVDAPLYAELPAGKEIVFGAGITDNTVASGAPNPDGFLYVYGYINDKNNGKKQMLVARTTPDKLESFADWRFWNGSDWSPRIEESAPLLDGVSPELSVTPMTQGRWKGKYLVVCEQDSVSGKVAYSAGDSPFGPFEQLTPLYYTAEKEDGHGIITYNAKAHPHLSQQGELLVSYNVNTTDAMASSANANIYRPRWLRIREIVPE
ncbi:discoidin domain-containing protein [Cohnella yongneupensis]|uniref:Discoidin domain-containing protein n=1 Tax=Cohnella yongneupensis TaxID=425006 RepID=A0ABW0R2M2_9BACL